MATVDPPPSEREANEQEESIGKEEVGKKPKRGRKKAENGSVTPQRRSSRRKEQVTSTGRPVREKKIIDRYSSLSPRRDSTPRPVLVKQGPGTKLEDIPTVFSKLSKWKKDDSLHHLHKILFGKTAKKNYIKRNIFQFSGIVLGDGEEEKGKLKLREKLEKCVKDRLLEFCDMLDIPVAKATTKKEDLLTSLLDFLPSPRVSRDVIVEENGQSGKKRKRRASLSTERTSAKKRRRREYKHEGDGNDADSEGKEDVQISSSKKTRKSSRSVVANGGKGTKKGKTESKELSKGKRQGSTRTRRRGSSEKIPRIAAKPNSVREVSGSRGSKSKRGSSSSSSKNNKVAKKHKSLRIRA